MRIFIAINLTPEVREQIIRSLQPFKKIGAPVRWVRPENLHLTLKFIGDTSPEKTREISETLASVRLQEPDPLVLEFDGFGFFGRDDMIRIFWVRVAPDPRLTALQQDIESRLAGIGIPPEDRPFHPHLTAGRNKSRFNTRNYRRQIAHAEGRRIARQEVKTFDIMESTLTPAGPEYRVLKEIAIES